MWKIIVTYFILQSLYLDQKTEAIKGSKIITAMNEEFPYIASLQLSPSGTNICTGNLITQKYMLTVAHCISDKKPKEIRVVFQVTSSTEFIKVHKVSSFLTYDKWAKKNRKRIDFGAHDIAVVELKHKVYEPNVNPIRLSQLPDGELEGREVAITGWHSGQLKKASVNILNNKDCERYVRTLINRTYEIGSGSLCSAAMPQVLIEKEDAGAPLIGDDNTLIGVGIGMMSGIKHAKNKISQLYRMNVHASVSYYWYFIVSSTDYQ